MPSRVPVAIPPFGAAKTTYRARNLGHTVHRMALTDDPAKRSYLFINESRVSWSRRSRA
jgi:hypothetical protein